MSTTPPPPSSPKSDLYLFAPGSPQNHQPSDSDKEASPELTGKMQDPFEVRMRFIALLKNLNATQTAAIKAAQVALKHKDMHEDLHSCIIEQLSEDNCSVNTRANIMCFVEVFMEAARADGQKDYVTMMQRDLPQIVKMVARRGHNGSNINTPLTQQVLHNMRTKNLISVDLYGELKSYLAENLRLAHESMDRHHEALADIAASTPSSGIDIPQQDALDKRQVETRIEEERERHKRLRENIWAVTEEEELARLWEDPIDFTEDDYRLMREEAEERYRNIAVCPTHGRSSMKAYQDIKWEDGYLPGKWDTPADAANADKGPSEAVNAPDAMGVSLEDGAKAAGDDADTAPVATGIPPEPKHNRRPPRGPARHHRGFPRSRGGSFRPSR